MCRSSMRVQLYICQLRYCCWKRITLVMQYMVDRPCRGTALIVTWVGDRASGENTVLSVHT